MSDLTWLNGVFMARTEAKISPLDRGFLFADGVYEVTAVYGGRLIDMERHLDRLERSLRELKFGTMPDRAGIEAAHRRLVADNGVEEGYVYLQVTRGAYAGRDFVAPDSPRLTLFAFSESKALIDTAHARDGTKVIVVDDIRWARRDIKTVGLLAQALAKTEAKRQGKDDAWMLAPDGFITEGASSNAWIVTQEGEIVTRANSNAILAGVTRHAIFDAVGQAGGRSGLKIVERSFTLEEAKSAVEAFTTAATGLVTPVVEIDGAKIGEGQPGRVTRAVQRLYYQALGADVGRVAPWTAG